MTIAPEVDVVVLAPIGVPGVAGNSIIFALRTLVAAGLSVELIDVTPPEQKSNSRRRSSASILALSARGRLHLAPIGRMSRPRLVLMLQVEPDNVTLEHLPVFDAPVIVAEAPRPMSVQHSPQDAVPGLDVAESTELPTLALFVRQKTSREIVLVPGGSSGASQLAAMSLPQDVTVETHFTSRFGPDVSQSGGVRPLLPGARPNFGRHSFIKEPEWESDPVALKKLLHPDEAFKSILVGRTTGLRRIIGRIPEDWDVRTVEVQAAISEIDYWTLGGEPTPEDIDDIGIEEALASGCIVLLPPDFQKWFGGAAGYASTPGVPARLRKTHGDRTQARNLSRRALAFTETHTAKHLLLRIQALLLPRTPMARHSALTGCKARDGDRYRVTFVTSNGAGLGHLTRLLAIAKSLPQDVSTSFISFSKAAPLVKTFDIPFTYVMSAGETGWNATQWNEYAAARLHREFTRIQPDMIVFDGNWPYKGFLSAAQASGAMLVWSLRGLWKSDADFSPLRLANIFDAVIAPGDVAEQFDLGWTASVATFMTPPIILTPEDGIKSRGAARETLGIDVDELAVLISLGAGKINDTRTLVERVTEEISLLPQRHNIYLTGNPLSPNQSRPANTQVIQHYPLAGLLPAFDWCVSAAGYNSVHEALAARLPGLWVPNERARTDDQSARARFVRDAGLGLLAKESDVTELSEGIRVMAEVPRRRRMRAAMEERPEMDGARSAADHLVELLKGSRP